MDINTLQEILPFTINFLAMNIILSPKIILGDKILVCYKELRLIFCRTK